MCQVPVALCPGSLALVSAALRLRPENLSGRQVQEVLSTEKEGVAGVPPELDTRPNNLFPTPRSMPFRCQHPFQPSESHLGQSFLWRKDEISKPGVGNEVRVLLADGFPIQQILIVWTPFSTLPHTVQYPELLHTFCDASWLAGALSVYLAS